MECDNEYSDAIKKINNDKIYYRGCPGPTGPTGPTGLSETITVGNTYTVEAGNKAIVRDVGETTSHIFEFTIPKGYDGPTGPTGPTGPSGEVTNRSAYLVTFNNGQITTGLSVASGERIPISREELDISDIIELDTVENTILFNEAGYYKVTITIHGYADEESSSLNFDPDTDFISIGFRLVGTDDIYIGASNWTYTKDPIELVAQGIISVPNIVNLYEIVNLGPKPLYLNTPSLDNILSESYFTNSLMTIIIEYLGRQGA